MKPQKIERVHQPGHEPLQQLALAEHDHRLVARTRVGHVAGALDPAGAVADERDEQRARRREQAAATASASAARARARRADVYVAPRLSQLGGDRRHDLVQVADHRVVGAGEDRRLGVGVDREDLLRALAAGDVLRGAADPAGDVEVGRDLRAGLADLVGVRAPAGARHRRASSRRRAPSSPASSSRIAKPSAEPTPRPPLTTTWPRRARRRRRPRSTRSATRTTRSACRAPARSVSTAGVAGRAPRPRRRAARRSAAAAAPWSARLLEQAAAPAHARDRRRRRRRAMQLAANGRSRRAATCASTSLPRSVPAATTAVGDEPVGELVDGGRPGLRRVGAAVDLGDVHASDAESPSRAAPRRTRARRPASPSAARERQRLQRQLVLAGARPGPARHHATPSSRMHLDDGGRRLGASPRISACLPWPGGHDQAHHLQPRRRGRPGSRPLDRLRARAQLRRAPTGSAAG